MGKFTVIPQDTFESLQLDAGVLLNKFNPANPVAPADEDIICATTGGINASCVPTYSDLGEDVDNCPANMKELKHLDSWEAKLAFTSLGTSAAGIRLALGAADINAATGAIIPRKDLKQTDFSDIWWVGDRADGGLVAVRLINALSTAGFTLQTTKNGKGQTSVELTGHVSIDAQNIMPMEFYSQDPEDTPAKRSITYSLSNVTSDNTAKTIYDGESYEATLTAAEDHTISTVIVLMGGVNVTSTAYDSATGKISIASVNGDISITAIATE